MKSTLVQIFLPLRDNEGQRFPGLLYREVCDELTQRWGGATAFTQSPATGMWENAEDQVMEDRVVMLEVMVQGLDVAWWQTYKKRLEAAFRQESILIRALPCDPL